MMKYSLGFPYFSRKDLSEKLKQSNLANCFFESFEKVINAHDLSDGTVLGAVSATEYGPLDFYSLNTNRLYTTGTRSFRPLASAHSILCESSCVAGIKYCIKAVNNTIIGGKISGFQALSVAQDYMDAGMAKTMIVSGGDTNDSGAVSASVAFGGIESDFYVEKIVTRFASQPSMISEIETEVYEELVKSSDKNKETFVLSDRKLDFTDEVFEGRGDSIDFFLGLKIALEKISENKVNIIFIDSDESGSVAGLLIESK